MCKLVPTANCSIASEYDQSNGLTCYAPASSCNIPPVAVPVAPKAGGPVAPGAPKSSASTFAPAVFAFLALTVLAVVF